MGQAILGILGYVIAFAVASLYPIGVTLFILSILESRPRHTPRKARHGIQPGKPQPRPRDLVGPDPHPVRSHHRHDRTTVLLPVVDPANTMVYEAHIVDPQEPIILGPVVRIPSQHRP